MLIKVVKNAMDFMEGKPHEANAGLSRRDFLGDLAKTAGVWVAMPAFFSLLKTDRALAAAFDSAYRSIPVAFAMHWHGGGDGVTRDIFPYDVNGAPFAGADTASMGIRSGNGANTTLVKGLALNMDSLFYKTLMAGGAFTNTDANGNARGRGAIIDASQVAGLLAGVSACLIHSSTGSDTGQNPISPIKLIQRMRIGSSATTVGSNVGTRNFDNTSGHDLVRAGRVADLVNSSTFQNGQLNKPDFGDPVEKAVQALMTAQMAPHATKRGADLFSGTVTRGLASAKSKFDPNVSATMYDPQNAANVGIYAGVNFANMTDFEKMQLAANDATARQVAGSANFNEGGYDYHNARHDDADFAAARKARNLLIWAIALRARAAKGMMFACSDGAINWSSRGQVNTENGQPYEGADGQPVALGDSDTKQMGVLYYYNPAGAPTLQKQLGYFEKESASRKPLVGQAPANMGVAVALNYAKAAGLVVSDAQLAEYLAEVNKNAQIVSSIDSLKQFLVL